jgi:hypothetical protein
MPHLTLARQPDGWVLSVVVGVNGQTTASLVAAGQPVPPPQSIRALLDTGTDITGLATDVLSRLGLAPVRQHTTQTISGPLSIQLFEVSLSGPRAGPPAGPLLVLDQLVVMGLATPPPGIEALLGRDVSDRLLVILDGPRAEFTVAD